MHRRLICSLLTVLFSLGFLCSPTHAQVITNDSGYSVSLLASGLDLPDGGMIYRAATHDLLVTQEDLGVVARVDTATGVVSPFADLRAYSTSNRGHFLYELNINSAGEVWAPLLDVGPVVRLDASGAVLGSFSIPDCGGAVAFDAQDNAFVGIGCPSRILKYAKGNYSSPALYASGFSGTQSFRFNATGQMFVADRAAGIVYQVTPGGTTASSHTVWASGLTLPDGIAIDPITQAVFVGDETGKITRITAPGVFSTFATGLTAAVGIGFDTAGNLYVADKFVGAIWKFTRNVPGTPSQIAPNHGGNAGTVSVQITGSGFQTGAQVKLASLGSDITGMNTTVVNSSLLATTFDLQGAEPGPRNVVVTAPDGASATLAGGFTVEQGGASQIWVDIIGLDKIRVGREQTFYVAYGNRGNIDAGEVPLWIQVPSNVGLSFKSSSNSLSSASSSTATENAVASKPAASQFVIGNNTLMTILFPRVPAGSTGVVPISLAVNSAVAPFNVEAWVNAPWIAQLSGQVVQGNPSAVKCLALLAVFGLGLPLGTEATMAVSTAQVLIDSQSSHVPATDAVSFLAASMQDYYRRIPGSTVPPFLQTLATNALSLYTALDACADVSQKRDDKSQLEQAVQALDPNDKVGSKGTGTQQYVSGATPLRYAVSFANQDSATAPAQQVVITDQLDTATDNLLNLTLGPITFGRQLITPPSSQSSFSTTVDLRPSNNLLVRIDAGLDRSTGLLQWNFTSLDPATSQPPADPSAGFLPPGGQGSVFFTVMPKPEIPTSTKIQNQAKIVFDASVPIPTQTWTNTIDNTRPTSHILPLASTQSSPAFTIQWSGTDVGSGVQNFTVFVSDNGGPFAPFLKNTTANSVSFIGKNGHTYAFFSIARDLVGNVEDAKTTAEASTTVPIDTTPPTTLATLSSPTNANGWNRFDVTVTLNSADSEPGGSGVKQIVFSATGAQSIPTTTVGGGSAILIINVEGITTLNYFAVDRSGSVEATQSLTVKLDKTAPEASSQFDLMSQDIVLFGRDPLSGVPPGSIAPTIVVPLSSADRDDDGDDDQGAELRIYNVLDLAGNSLIVKEKVRKKTRHSITAEIASLQYNGGTVVSSSRNRQTFAWRFGRDGSLRELQQTVEVGTEHHEQELTARFNAERNETVIRDERNPHHKVVRPGLVLLQMSTTTGNLSLEF